MSEAGPERLALLVVDDDEVDRLFVARAFQDAGVEAHVDEAAEASAGLAALRARRFDCALLDLRMPGRDGLWLLRQARAECPETPLVVLTGQGDEQTAVSLMKAGAADYLPKGDLTPDRLVQTVRQVVRVARAEADARRAREAQAESESLLRLTIDKLPVLISYVDDQGRYRWNNLAYQHWFGVERAALVGRHVREVVGEPAFELLRPYVEQALAGKAVTYTRELPFASGRRWVEVSYVPHLRGDGTVAGFVALVQDVTERRRQEEDKARQREFEQQLLGIVSHDLRNPINAIALGAAVLSRRADLPAEARPALERIVKSTERVVRMIRDLLDFTQARLGGGIPIAPRPTDLHEITRQSVEEVQASFPGRRVALAAEGDASGRWDPDRLAQVVGNLVTNAIAYSPPDSAVGVCTRGDGDRVVLEVTNEGTPIAPEALSGLFLPFRRGHASAAASEGSIGLGLYIVEQIVAAHGGTVDVESAAGRATTFRVILPRGSAAPGA